MADRRGIWVTAAGACIGAGQAAGSLLHARPLLLAPFSLLLVFVIPGVLAFQAVLRRLPGTVTEAAVAVAASLGATIVTGIVLTATPTGLSQTGWSIALPALVIGLAAIALARRGGASGKTPSMSLPRAWTVAGVLACAGLLAAGAAVSIASERQSLARTTFTELWLTRSGNVETVHVRNEQGATTQYSVQILIPSRPATWHRIRLRPGWAWTTAVILPLQPLRAAPGARVTWALRVQLRRAGVPGVYRWVGVTGRTG